MSDGNIPQDPESEDKIGDSMVRLCRDLMHSLEWKGVMIIAVCEDDEQRIAQQGLSYEEIKTGLCHAIYLNELIGHDNEESV